MNRVELMRYKDGHKIIFKALSGPLNDWRPIVTLTIKLDHDGVFNGVEYKNTNENIKSLWISDLETIKDKYPHFIKYLKAAVLMYEAFDETQN